jgi:hypothetical protein
VSAQHRSAAPRPRAARPDLADLLELERASDDVDAHTGDYFFAWRGNMATKPKQNGPDRRPARERPDDANAFLPDPDGGPARSPEDLSETLAEEFVHAATSGEDRDEEMLDATVPEEIGGPFIETSAEEELAGSVDDLNPSDAEPEPFPRAVAGVVTAPDVDERLDRPRGRKRS